MICEIHYTTFEGASGSSSVELEDLPKWLALQPGAHILEIIPAETLEQQEKYRSFRRQALTNFIQGIQRSF